MVIEGSGYVLHTPDMVDRLAYLLRRRIAEGGSLRVDIRAYVPPKTRKQRDYLHAIIRQIADIKGVDERQLKEDIKAQFGVVEVAPSLVTGDRVARKKSTELYSRDEYSAVISLITAWAATEGIKVMPPASELS